MKNKLPTILLALSLSSLVGFTIGDEVELDTYLSGRTSPSFMKYSKNITTTLSSGTTGEVLEIKNFETGNSGIKMKVTSGPKSGQSYWVYYNSKDPAISVSSKKTKQEVTPETVAVKPTGQPEETLFAKSLREVSAKRDVEEHAIEQTALVAAETLERESLQDMIAPMRAPCTIAGAGAPPPAENASVYTPVNALADINSGKLTFMGRVRIASRGGQNYSCMYKNDKVYVVYNNCMGNKKEAAATDIEIIAQNGDYFKFYLEIYDSPLRPSQMKRSDYRAGTWDLVYAQGKPPGKMNIAQLKQYMEIRPDEQGGNACWMGGSNKVKDLNLKSACIGNLSSKQNEWANNSEDFWRNPTNDWYDTQKSLRKTVENTSF